MEELRLLHEPPAPRPLMIEAACRDGPCPGSRAQRSRHAEN